MSLDKKEGSMRGLDKIPDIKLTDEMRIKATLTVGRIVTSEERREILCMLGLIDDLPKVRKSSPRI